MDVDNTKAVQNDIHAVLSSTIGPVERVILSSSPPKIALPAQSPLLRFSRPATASGVEERQSLLPASSSISSSSKGSLTTDLNRATPEHSRSSSRQSMPSSPGMSDQMHSAKLPLKIQLIFINGRLVYKPGRQQHT